MTTATTPPPRRVPAGTPPTTGVAQATAGGGSPFKMMDGTPPRPRMVLYAPEKWGKTATAVHAPNAKIIMARDETGYLTLLGAGRVPKVPAAKVDSWTDLLSALDHTAGDETLILDSLGSIAKLAAEYICNKHFDDDFGEHGYASYGKGNELTSQEWMQLLRRLDAAHSKGATVVILGHSIDKRLDPPDSASFTRYVPDVHEKIWNSTARWSDCILFGKFETFVVEKKADAKLGIADKKGKAVGGRDRIIHAQSCDAWVAGNRYGMDPEIRPVGGPDEVWKAIESQYKGAKQ